MTCAQPDLSGYRDFSRRVQTVAAGRRVPVTGSWEVTARCNLRCSFCYLAGAPRAPDARAREVPTEQILRIADQLVEAGCLWLAVTGGEPLVRPDFPEIYRGLAQRGLLLTLCTNGTLVTEALADLLAEMPPLAVEITLYGATAQTYERVTGVAGSFEACHRAIELLLQRSVRLRLKSTVSTVNAHEVGAMTDQARALGVPFRFDAQLNPRLDGGRDPLDQRLSPEQVVQLDLTPERRKAFAAAFDKCEPRREPRERLFECCAGLTTFHIDATGHLGGCILVRDPAVDLTRTGFDEGWRALAGLRRQVWTVDAQCRQCEWLDSCAQCPGWAALEGESPQDVVRYLCNITQRRLQLFRSE